VYLTVLYAEQHDDPTAAGADLSVLSCGQTPPPSIDDVVSVRLCHQARHTAETITGDHRVSSGPE